MIREIKEYCNVMFIYYLDMNDYKKKLKNIIAVFGKKIATEKIQKKEIVFKIINSN